MVYENIRHIFRNTYKVVLALRTPNLNRKTCHYGKHHIWGHKACSQECLHDCTSFQRIPAMNWTGNTKKVSTLKKFYACLLVHSTKLWLENNLTFSSQFLLLLLFYKFEIRHLQASQVFRRMPLLKMATEFLADGQSSSCTWNCSSIPSVQSWKRGSEQLQNSSSYHSKKNSSRHRRLQVTKNLMY